MRRPPGKPVPRHPSLAFQSLASLDRIAQPLRGVATVWDSGREFGENMHPLDSCCIQKSKRPRRRFIRAVVLHPVRNGRHTTRISTEALTSWCDVNQARYLGAENLSLWDARRRGRDMVGPASTIITTCLLISGLHGAFCTRTFHYSRPPALAPDFEADILNFQASPPLGCFSPKNDFCTEYV